MLLNSHIFPDDRLNIQSRQYQLYNSCICYVNSPRSAFARRKIITSSSNWWHFIIISELQRSKLWGHLGSECLIRVPHWLQRSKPVESFQNGLRNVPSVNPYHGHSYQEKIIFVIQLLSSLYYDCLGDYPYTLWKTAWGPEIDWDWSYDLANSKDNPS